MTATVPKEVNILRFRTPAYSVVWVIAVIPQALRRTVHGRQRYAFEEILKESCLLWSHLTCRSQGHDFERRFQNSPVLVINTIKTRLRAALSDPIGSSFLNSPDNNMCRDDDDTLLLLLVCVG